MANCKHGRNCVRDPKGSSRDYGRALTLPSAGTRSPVSGCAGLYCQLYRGRRADSDPYRTLALIEINAIFLLDGDLIDKPIVDDCHWARLGVDRAVATRLAHHND
jgi:hypothetical protein